MHKRRYLDTKKKWVWCTPFVYFSVSRKSAYLLVCQFQNMQKSMISCVPRLQAQALLSNVQIRPCKYPQIFGVTWGMRVAKRLHRIWMHPIEALVWNYRRYLKIVNWVHTAIPGGSWMNFLSLKPEKEVPQMVTGVIAMRKSSNSLSLLSHLFIMCLINADGYGSSWMTGF